ncbi:MAG: ABC transporter permease [Bacillota bacterium]|nr:ABC transporter permease [Bacillota bacterium]
MTFFELVVARWSKIAVLTQEHIFLVFISVLVAMCLGIAIGIAITYYQPAARVILAFCQILMTVPSLAMVGLLLPLFGIGFKTGVAALILYSLLPIVRNTYTGIQEISPPILEAAKGMGMKELTILRRIKLPVAFPVIMAGIRTAVVMIVGIAAIASYIGAGGLGEFIFRGISQWNKQLVLLGAICISVLAIVFDLLFKYLEHHLREI